jgi:hypothetical protein
MLCSKCGLSAVDWADEINAPFPSPVQKLMGTNDIPSAAESSSIRNVLSQAASDISRLDMEIERQKAVLDRLVHKRAAVQKLADEHRILVSPLRRFPTELLSEIFLLSLPDSSTFRATEPPCLLGQICSLWRHIALSTPMLWSSLSIELWRRDADAETTLVKTWLQRSGNCPLSLTCADRPYPSYTYSGDPTTHPVLDVIASCSDRWADVRLDVPIDVLHRLDTASSEMPHLTSLVLRGTGSSPLTRSLDIFATAPHLRRITLANIAVQHLRVPWIQMTVCDVTHDNVKDCLDILSMSPNLRQCTFNSMAITSPAYPPIVRHEQLRFLSLTYTIPRNEGGICAAMADLLDHLTLPALCDFKLMLLSRGPHRIPKPENWPQESLLLFLSRSSCPLSRLSIYGATDEQLLQCLMLAPSVVVLDISSPNTYSNKFLRGLTIPAQMDGWSAVAPNLQHIRYTGVYEFNFSTLVSMVASRWRCANDSSAKSADRSESGVMPLQSIGLYGHFQGQSIAEDDLLNIKRLEGLKNEGLAIIIERFL